MDAVERFLKQKLQLETQQKGAGKTSESKMKLRTATATVTTPSKTSGKRSLLGEFKEEQKIRKTVGGITTSTIKSNLNINVSEQSGDFAEQLQQDNQEEQHLYSSNGAPRVSISTQGSKASRIDTRISNLMSPSGKDPQMSARRLKAKMEAQQVLDMQETTPKRRTKEQRNSGTMFSAGKMSGDGQLKFSQGQERVSAPQHNVQYAQEVEMNVSQNQSKQEIKYVTRKSEPVKQKVVPSVNLKSMIQEKTELQMKQMLFEKQKRMKQSISDRKFEITSPKVKSSRATYSSIKTPSNEAKKTFTAQLQQKIAREIMEKSMTRSPKVRSTKSRLSVNRHIINYNQAARITLADLPADIFRVGILSNLLHHTPIFSGHYFGNAKKLRDLQTIIDLGYYAQPNNNITIYTENEYREIGNRPDIGSNLLTVFCGALPTIEIFKIAMLNKKFQQLILNVFKPLKMCHFKKFYEVMQAVEVFVETPNFEKYKDLKRLDSKTNSNNFDVIQGYIAAFDSPTFGGSILGPLDRKQNLMYESIMKIRGTHGGFYELHNVKQGDKLYDIEILIDWEWISSQQGFKKLVFWHETFSEIDDLKNRPLSESCIEFSELKNYLTGYARVIEVQTDANNTVYQIESITEGKMNRGRFDGYARKFKVQKVKNTYVPNCRVGYWRDNMPFGSSIYYENDLKKNCTIQEQGIFDGQKESNLDITDFKINNFPKRGIEEEAAKKEAARLRAEALLKSTEEMASRAFLIQDPAPAPAAGATGGLNLALPGVTSGDLGEDFDQQMSDRSVGEVAKTGGMTMGLGGITSVGSSQINVGGVQNETNQHQSVPGQMEMGGVSKHSKGMEINMGGAQQMISGGMAMGSSTMQIGVREISGGMTSQQISMGSGNMQIGMMEIGEQKISGEMGDRSSYGVGGNVVEMQGASPGLAVQGVGLNIGNVERSVASPLGDPFAVNSNVQIEGEQSVGTLGTLGDVQKINFGKQTLNMNVSGAVQEEALGSFSPMSAGSPEGSIRISNAIGSNMPMVSGSQSFKQDLNFSQVTAEGGFGATIGSNLGTTISPNMQGTIGVMQEQLAPVQAKVEPQTFFQKQLEDEDDSDPAEFDSDGMPAAAKQKKPVVYAQSDSDDDDMDIDSGDEAPQRMF